MSHSSAWGGAQKGMKKTCICPLVHQSCSLLVAGLEETTGGRMDSLTNADAERVLLRVKQKLEGLEGGTPDHQGLPYGYVQDSTM